MPPHDAVMARQENTSHLSHACQASVPRTSPIQLVDRPPNTAENFESEARSDDSPSPLYPPFIVVAVRAQVLCCRLRGDMNGDHSRQHIDTPGLLRSLTLLTLYFHRS